MKVSILQEVGKPPLRYEESHFLYLWQKWGICGYLWCLQAPFLFQVPLTHSKVHGSIMVLLTSSPNLTPSCSQAPPPSLATFFLLTQLSWLCFLFALLCSCFSHYDFSILSPAIHPPLSHRQPWPCTGCFSLCSGRFQVPLSVLSHICNKKVFLSP